MKKITFNIYNKNTGSFLKFNLLEGSKGWQCILCRDSFRFRMIAESPLQKCIEILAKYIAPMNMEFAESENMETSYMEMLKHQLDLAKNGAQNTE
jgi:hypothetical protein